MTNDRRDDTTRSGADGAGRSAARACFRRGVVGALLAFVVLAPPLAAFVFVAGLPAGRIARQNVGAAPSAAERQADGRGTPARGESLQALRSDEAFWRSRLALVQQEKISLAVDLVDSVAVLDIRGVPARICKIHRIETSRALPVLKNTSEFRDRVSKPMVIRRDKSTIPKEPIRVEIAPKDTTEAAKAATRPLAPEEVDVYFTLFLDGGLAIAVRQLEKPSTRTGFWRKSWVDFGEHVDQAGNAVRSLIRSELPQHELRIEVTLARDDAKAVYRALGPEARLALRL